MPATVRPNGWNSSDLTALRARLNQSDTVLDTVAREICGTSITIVDGTLYASYFTPLGDLTVSAISFNSVTASASQTLVRFGLFTAAANGDLTVVAQTENDVTLLSANNTIYKKSFDTGGGFPATYTLLKGVRYAVGFVLVGGSPGTVRGFTSTAALTALAPRITATKASQSDIANVASVTNAGTGPWARVEV